MGVRDMCRGASAKPNHARVAASGGKGAGPSSRGPAAPVANDLAGMHRRQDGKWVGAQAPRCRVALGGSDARDAKSKTPRATVTEPSSAPPAKPESDREPAFVGPVLPAELDAADLSWTPTGFVPDHENNIVALLHHSASGNSRDAERPDSDDGLDSPPRSRVVTEGMPVVFVTAEVSPWSKTGGLGDVCGALPAALAARGHAVAVIAPMYEDYPDVEDTGRTATFRLGDEEQTVRYHARRDFDGVTYLFVQHHALQRGGGARIYAHAPGQPYPDNDFRFALLSLAAAEAPLCVPWSELFFGGGAAGEARRRTHLFTSSPVFVANDWHAALVPVFLAARYQANAAWTLEPRNAWAPEGAPAAMSRAVCVTIVHNLFHLGCFPSSRYRMLGLPEENTEWFPALRWRWNDGGESMNFLKAGLATSAAAVLVSPSYANEVQTNELGCGMDKVLRSVGNFGSDVDLGVFNGMSGKLRGIVNGIDVEEWNPAADPHLPARYSVDAHAVDADVLDVVAGKSACKLALQRELGLHEDSTAPLIGFIGRLDRQKGVDVLLDIVPRIVEAGGQVVMLGSGDPGLEDGMREMEHRFKGRAVGWVGFSVPVSHRITAAADILAMPSRFEPCGLNQLYALRYGTLPVAHKTGGLRDTVTRDVGWPFSPCDAEPLWRATERAMRCYRDDEERWRKKQTRAMRKNLSWDVAAEQYERLMRGAAAPPPTALNREALESSDPALAAAAAAAGRDDDDAMWVEAERRAERVRQRAARAPDRDTRALEGSGDEPGWTKMLPRKLRGLF